MDENEAYFPKTYSGTFIEDLIILSQDGFWISLFGCKVCAALVKNPGKHIEWHTRK